MVPEWLAQGWCLANRRPLPCPLGAGPQLRGPRRRGGGRVSEQGRREQVGADGRGQSAGVVSVQVQVQVGL